MHRFHCVLTQRVESSWSGGSKSGKTKHQRRPVSKPGTKQCQGTRTGRVPRSSPGASRVCQVEQERAARACRDEEPTVSEVVMTLSHLLDRQVRY